MDTRIPQPDPIENIERTLRDLIHDLLSTQFGPEWHKSQGLGQEWLDGLEAKRRTDEGVQKNLVVRDLPITYAEFSDLGKLLEKHCSTFKPILPDWDAFLVYIRTTERLRNIVKHHRDISPDQWSLLAGIAGELDDAVALHRIGARLHVKLVILQFRELIPLDASIELALKNASECVKRWHEEVLHAVATSGLDTGKLKTEVSNFEGRIRGQGIDFKVSTNPAASPSYEVEGKPYTGVHSQLVYKFGCRAELTMILSALKRPYHFLGYDLDGVIDVESLQQWSIERVGLSPGGTASKNGELLSIEYRLLGGELCISAAKYVDPDQYRYSRISATCSEDRHFFRAHETIEAKHLLGFMLGNIPPRTMMHLVRVSQP